MSANVGNNQSIKDLKETKDNKMSKRDCIQGRLQRGLFWIKEEAAEVEMWLVEIAELAELWYFTLSGIGRCILVGSFGWNRNGSNFRPFVLFEQFRNVS